MADRRGDDDAVLEGGLIQQGIDKTAACVIAHKFLRHVIVHKCRIGPAVFNGLHGILPGLTEDLFGIRRIGVLHTAGRTLIRRGHRLDLPVKIAADNFGRSYRDIRRSDPQMIGFRCALVDACINGNIEALILLQGEILLAGMAENELIGKTGILCQLFKIIRQDAFYLTVFQHFLHIAPALVVADILVIDVPIPRHQAEKIIAVAAFSAVLVHHVVAVHCKKADSDRIPRGLCGIFRSGGKRVQHGHADQRKQKRGCFVKGGFYPCCTHRAATMASLYTTAIHKTSDSRFVVPISESCFASGF